MTITNSSNEDEENVVFQKPAVHSDTDTSFEDQRRIIKESKQASLVKGEIWYLLDNKWYQQWKRYVETPKTSNVINEHPGQIDNSGIIDSATGDLKEHMLESREYHLVNEQGWVHLTSWYNVLGEPITRKVIEHGVMKERQVEVYLIHLNLCEYTNQEKVIVRQFSRMDTINDVVAVLRELFEIEANTEIKVWSKVNNLVSHIKQLDKTLLDHTITSGQGIIIEQKKEGSEWPRPRNRSRSSTSIETPISEFGSSSATRSTFESTSVTPGLCGLSNIGNTCFMNSALQCLSNTVPLTNYFENKTYRNELNPTNPLGHRGKIAEAYADLIHYVWSGKCSYFTPRQFKTEVGRFAPQFSGYQQQDSHELLAFLLDGLHEDLNRVKQKPYIELQDDKGRPDQIVSEEAWHNHMKRNDSIIVELFHGLFKSCVRCPDCKKKSVTFDPFCYFSLPLPIKNDREITITFIPLDRLKNPMRLKVSIPKVGNAFHLTTAVSKLTETDPKKLIMADIYNHRFYKRFEPRDSLSQITDADAIHVYEMPVNMDKLKEEKFLILPVYLRNITEGTYTTTPLFGTPMLIAVPKESCTANDLYTIILRSMKRFVSEPLLAEEHDEKQTEEESVSSDISSDDEEENKRKKDSLQNEKARMVPTRLFQVSLVNAQGTNINENLNFDDETPISLSPNSFIAVNWYPKTKEQYFSEELANKVDIHESLDHSVPSKENIDLKDCFDLFIKEEKLGEEDPWFCPDCKDHKQAFKKFDLWTLPKILVIHLKRFSYTRLWRDKLDVLVNFPIKQLDLSEYIINENHPRAVYDLHAVSNHFGGMGGGHYTAYGINCIDGQWYYFDDTSVSVSSASSVVSKAAYVLFYTRRGDPDSEDDMNTSKLIDEGFINDEMDIS